MKIAYKRSIMKGSISRKRWVSDQSLKTHYLCKSRTPRALFSPKGPHQQLNSILLLKYRELLLELFKPFVVILYWYFIGAVLFDLLTVWLLPGSEVRI